MLTNYAFLMQASIWVIPIIGSYIAYRQVRVAQKKKSVRQDLFRLGIAEDASVDADALMGQMHGPGDYFWPLFYASGLTVVVYSMTHPTVVQTGLWTGVLEEQMALLGPDPGSMDHTVLVARTLFWGWMGAYIYAFNTIWRRFMSYDLTPSVYIFVATRMALAFVFGGTMVLVVSLVPVVAIDNYNTQMIVTSLTAFFVGFFPERGLDWIAATVERFTGDNARLSKETRLSELEGLSVWHQGRLKQQDIENVQNLATADIELLVIATPFGLAQIIDWIDQAILLTYANETTYDKLDNSGVRCASDFVFATRTPEGMQSMANVSGVSLDLLKMLRLSMQSSTNLELVAYCRWHTSIDPERVSMAQTLREQLRRRLAYEKQAMEQLQAEAPRRFLGILDTHELKSYREAQQKAKATLPEVSSSQKMPDAN